MSTITTTTPVATSVHDGAEPQPRIWRVGAAAGVVAAVATSLTAVAATAAGQDLEVGGEVIPTSGFAVLTLVGAVFGMALAKLAQRARHPHRTFLAVTAALTAVSIVPDVLADATWSIRLFLAATHLIAAAIIVPALARRLQP